MRAAFLKKAGSLCVEEVPRPVCAEGTLLINVKEVGVCGSDLHYFNEGRIGDHVVTSPHILGHEAAGIVAEVGRGVTGFAVGDRVVLEPGVPCGRCAQCRSGRYNLCPDVCFSGAPPHHGMFREYLTHDPAFVYRLPDQVSLTAAALAEPLAVAHNAVKKGQVSAGDTVLVTGAGPIGFACIEMALVAGAALVVVSEPRAYRRTVALKIGAGHAVDPVSVELPAAVADITGRLLCDCVLEASGDETAIADAVRCARRGGRVVYVGMGKGTVAIPHAEILKREATVTGVYRYVNDFRPVIALLAAGRIEAEAWVSHRFPLERIAEAFATANDPAVEKLKVMVST